MNNLVTILSFSPRNDGNCAAVGNYISKYYKNSRLIVLDGERIQPCGNCSYECLKPEMRCPQLTEEYLNVMDSICRSKLVYFIVPNYCGYPCANYFAFNERSVGYFNMDQKKMECYMSVSKRFIVISNTEGFENALQQQTNEAPEILYLKSGKYGKASITGDILESDAARADLDQFLSCWKP